MKVAPLIAVALILCIAFLLPIQAKKKKFCIGKDGNHYELGKGYDDNEGKVCVRYKCVKKKKEFVMKKGKCASLTVDGVWSDWSGWSACTSTSGAAMKTRKRTCTSPPPSDDGSPCPGLKEQIEECSLPSCETTTSSTGDISTIVKISQQTKRSNTDINLNKVIKFNVHYGMGSDCYSKYSKIYPYPAGQGKSLSECQTMCTNNPECGAIVMLKASVESGGSTSCYMVKPNNLFNEGTCTWGSGTYNAYEKKITVLIYKAYKAMESSCYSKYTKIYPYPAASSKSLSECQTICSEEPKCGAIVMKKSSVESGGTTSCYMIKPNNLFNEGTCTWGNGNYNAYEQKTTVCTADAITEAACFCKSATSGAGEACAPEQKCNGDGTCQDGHTFDVSTWEQTKSDDCWSDCGKKGGACPSFCGSNGYCCRKGYDGCPPRAGEASPIMHTCVTEIGHGENVNVTALELNVQSLNDSVETLQATMQSILELMITMQSTVNKQVDLTLNVTSLEASVETLLDTVGSLTTKEEDITKKVDANTAKGDANAAAIALKCDKSSCTTIQAAQTKLETCLGDVTSSDCPTVPSGKTGVATVSANAANLANKCDATKCTAVETKVTDVETCLADVNSANCPSSKGGKTSVSDAIMENKDAIVTHHPADPVYFIAGGVGAERDIALYHPTDDNVNCSISPPTLNNDWYHHSTFYHRSTIYMCGGEETSSTCISHNTNTEGWKTHTLRTVRQFGHSSVVLHNRLYLIGGLRIVESQDRGRSKIWSAAQSTPLPLTKRPILALVRNLDYRGNGQCVVKIDENTLVITDTWVSTYNVKTSTSTTLPSLKEPRSNHGCVVVERGNKKWIIVAGGGDYLYSTEMLQLGESDWTSIGHLHLGRIGPSMVVTPRGVMVIGGNGHPDGCCPSDTSLVELLDWDNADKTWSTFTPSFNTYRAYFGGAVEIPASMFNCTG